jgi:CspA family cold shock protein
MDDRRLTAYAPVIIKLKINQLLQSDGNEHTPHFNTKQGYLLGTEAFYDYLCALINLQFLQMDTQITGTVKFFNEEKGFGFIKHDNSNKETFVHANGLVDQIEANDKVVFDVQEGRKGLNAVNVKRLS